MPSGQETRHLEAYESRRQYMISTNCLVFFLQVNTQDIPIKQVQWCTWISLRLTWLHATFTGIVSDWNAWQCPVANRINMTLEPWFTHPQMMQIFLFPGEKHFNKGLWEVHA